MSQAPSQTPSIREALADDAWEGHEDPLTAADLDAIAEVASQAASVIAVDQYEAFEHTDGAWIAGWHSATKHVAAALAKQTTGQTPAIREALTDDAWEGHEDPLTAADLDAIAEATSQAASVIAVDQYDAFLSSPNLDRSWIDGWHAAVKHIAAVLANQNESQQ